MDTMNLPFDKILNPVTIIIFAVGFLAIKFLLVEPKGLPPGPKRWPLVGSLTELPRWPLDEWPLGIARLAKEYKGLFMLKLGSQYYMVLSEHSVVRQCLDDCGHFLADRPQHHRPHTGVTSCPGAVSPAVRRYTQTALEAPGLGQVALDVRLREEMAALAEELSGQSAEHPGTALSTAVTNVVTAVFFGERLEYHSDELQRLVFAITEISQLTTFPDMVEFLPWLQYLGYKPKSLEKEHLVRQVESLIAEKIEEHRKSYNEDRLRDFVDLFIANEGNKFAGSDELTEGMKRQMLLDLYLGAVDTTSSVIVCALYQLSVNPKIQKRCYKEIEKTIGLCRPPCLDDQAKLPYLCGVINEALRLTCANPLSVPRKCTRPLRLFHDGKDVLLPEGSTVLLSLHALHRDPKHWPHPLSCQPDRWLSGSEHESFFPFGLGHRSCIGEYLARSIIFMFISGLLQKFKLSSAGQEKSQVESENDLLDQLQNFQLVTSNRYDNSKENAYI